MLNLITYRKAQFARLRNLLESDGYDFISVLSLARAADNAQQAEKRNKALDVSSLLPLLDPSSSNRDLGAALETLLYRMPDTTVFIADETVASRYAYETRTLFDASKPCNIKGAIEDQTMPTEKKPKRLIDLGDSETKELLDQFVHDLIGQDNFKDDFRKQVEIFRLFNSIGDSRFSPCS